MDQSNAKNQQYRGHCQCCGREQAVRFPAGLIAHHGYTVKDGWFQGACAGHQFAPIETDRGIADSVVMDVLKQVEELRLNLDRINRGEMLPETVKVRRGTLVASVPYSNATLDEQARSVNGMRFRTEQRIRAGEQFAKMIQDVADAYHGQPLKQVAKKEAPAPIRIGEVRISQRGNLRSVTVVGAKVKWVDERGFRGSSSTRSWRGLKIASEAFGVAHE